MSASSGSSSFRSLSEISEVSSVRISIDLVAAAKRNIGFFRLVHESHWLHHKSTILQAIRRYDKLWMPLMADLSVGSTPPMILPPLDIEWVWFCHTLNPASYKQYCESRFPKIIGKPTIFDEEIEEYALGRCKEIWDNRYPSEPFVNETDENVEALYDVYGDLMDLVLKHRYLYTKFSEHYRSELMYLISARQRYKGFLHMVHRFADGYSCLVPTSDIALMWLTHQSYPTMYTLDTKELEDGIDKVLGIWETIKEEDAEETKKLWEKTFEQPYEKAGGAIDKITEVNPVFYWGVSDVDVNTKYKSMVPRFLLEVFAMVKLIPKTGLVKGDVSKEFLRLKMVRGHRELELDKPLCNITSALWIKAWHLFCEFGTKGLVLEVRQQGGNCFKDSSLRDRSTFLWNDLLRAPSLTISKDIDRAVNAVASITPPVQAPYLLKCVPDRVTDDSGAMISDVILKINQYRPQKGRWLSRTVLDHSSRECFVIRIRVGEGFWRRGGESPSTVKWEDRVVEICEGSWSYVAGSIGRAPEKVVGTASPKEPPEGWQALWNFSSGEELLIRWDSSASASNLNFTINNQQSNDYVVKLLSGRKLQYQLKKPSIRSTDEDVGFVTLVRVSEDDPIGKATALINWKLMVVELMPEEDAVFILLICNSIVRTITELTNEDVASLLVRRRLKEAKIGDRNWGSVVLHPSSYSSSDIASPHLQPWYWNAGAVMAPQRLKQVNHPPALSYSQAEGGDKLFKRGIIPASST
ncbi:hypothetical protein LIER_29102 [Lithospermum erythrorhizon]|uniref:GRPD C-terminal domain-containing protein n=1 Tax=Lithospermum erythrorhizon TaxID=34254 RepID=A0AAV3RLN8_LITER